MAFLFLMGLEGFVIVTVVVILIDQVSNELRHTHTRKGSVADKLHTMDFIDIDMGFPGFIRTVRVKDREEPTELFFSSVGTDKFLCFRVEEFPDLFLFGFAPGVIDEEGAFTFFLIEPAVRDGAYELGCVRIVGTVHAVLQFLVIGNDYDLGHMYEKRRTWDCTGSVRPARYNQIPGEDW